MLILRTLDPAKEQALFRDSYLWRTKPKRHLQPDRIPFEVFAANDPTQIVVGLFNETLQAVYFFHEYAPNCLEVHFTSRKDALLDEVLAGGATILQILKDNGVKEVSTLIKAKNVPLRRVAEILGFEGTETDDGFIRYVKI